MQSACRALDGIARVADMAAAALVVGMQNVKAEHLAVRLGDTDLKKRLDDAIASMEQDGTMNALRSKWGVGQL